MLKQTSNGYLHVPSSMIVSGFVLIDYYLLLQSMHDHEIYILPFDVLQYFLVVIVLKVTLCLFYFDYV